MRILLDECVDERFRHGFSGHDCQTAHFAKLAGLRNGQLLAAAEALGFDVLITVDQGIPYQQNVASHRIAVLVLCAPRNRLNDLRKLTSTALAALSSISPGKVIRIP
jgi:hypothetical protein